MVCATKKTLKHQCKVSVGSRDFARFSLDGVRRNCKFCGARLALDGVHAVGNYNGQNFWRPPKFLPKFFAAELLCVAQ